MGSSGEAWSLGIVCPGDWEAQTLIALLLESALDDLDLNEFGVAALEKTFDSSTGPHPGSITIGTGLRRAGWREGSGGPSGPGWVDGAVPYLAWPRMASLPHLAPPGLSCRRQFAAELCAGEHPGLLGQFRLLPLGIPVPSR